ncbi:MAG: DnaJ domain-containing protein [Lachnospiraceae bacterium]|nr:DnaJ domain-containing protein [Lachnospiraceae bacterium]
MINPYTILGVSENATDDEIKKAYRSLSRKYHPDANINNPNKDQAEEKFKEIQQAYQQIMDMREKGYKSYSEYSGRYGTGNNSSYGYGSGGYGGSDNRQYREYDFRGFEDFFRAFGFGGFEGENTGYGNSNTAGAGYDERFVHMQAAANYINNRRYNEALNVLNSINNRDGQWYYMAAVAHAGLGNNIKALEFARSAVNMEPDNYNYRELLNRLQSGGRMYRDRQNPYGGTVINTDNMCLKLCFLNLFCNLCCGGGGMCYGGYGPGC